MRQRQRRYPAGSQRNNQLKTCQQDYGSSRSDDKEKRLCPHSVRVISSMPHWAAANTPTRAERGVPGVCTPRDASKLQNIEYRICLKAQAAETHAPCFVHFLVHHVLNIHFAVSHLSCHIRLFEYNADINTNIQASSDKGPNALQRAIPDAYRNKIPTPKYQLTRRHCFHRKPLPFNRLTKTKEGLRISSRERRMLHHHRAQQFSPCEMTNTIAAGLSNISVDSIILQPTLSREQIHRECGTVQPLSPPDMEFERNESGV